MSVRLTPVLIFVRRFERCLRFYQKAFGLKLVRIYRGKEHPRWAEFQVGGIRLALHGSYKGPPYREGALTLDFKVKDIHKTLEKIKRYGGAVKSPPKKVELIPEHQVVYTAAFVDPDRNEFHVKQVLQEFSE